MAALIGILDKDNNSEKAKIVDGRKMQLAAYNIALCGVFFNAVCDPSFVIG